MADDKAWPPGFRFHPTDEELVLYYLKRKICRRKINLDIIAETDVYKWDPEELPGLSLLKTGDRQWFFFSPRDRKYPNGARSNRATRQGYWKATGKDRIVTCNSRNVGVKKTLVFYKGRAPSGSRTDWVMHEYTLDEEEFKRCQNVKDYYALYKVFKKSGPGPKNGEQYGALFKEEDWPDVECHDFNNFDGQEIPMKHLNEVSSVANVRESVESLLSFDDIDDQEIPMKQLNEVSSGANVRESVESLLSFDDMEELMKQIPDEPVFDFLDGHDNLYSTSQVLVQETEKSSVVDLCSGDLIFPKPEEILHSSVLMCGVQGSLNFTDSNISLVDSYEGPDISSTFAPNFSKESEVLIEEDFLEIDDLLDIEPAALASEKPADNLLVENLDGFGEFDMFHDAALFLHDLEPDNLEFGHTNHGAVAELYLNRQNILVNQVDSQLQSDTNFLTWNSDPLWLGGHPNNNFNVPEPHHAYVSQPPPDIPCESFRPIPKVIQNQGNEGSNDGGAMSRFSSSLWAFVESIPTTPASAAENKLVHLAFERMSSFKKLKINPRNTQVATSNAVEYKKRTGKVRGFVFISMILAFSAVFLAMIGGFGHPRNWILTL